MGMLLYMEDLKRREREQAQKPVNAPEPALEGMAEESVEETTEPVKTAKKPVRKAPVRRRGTK